MKTFSLRKEDVTHRWFVRSEEHTSELQSRSDLVCRLLLEKKKKSRCRQFLLSPLTSPLASPSAPPRATRLTAADGPLTPPITAPAIPPLIHSHTKRIDLSV